MCWTSACNSDPTNTLSSSPNLLHIFTSLSPSELLLRNVHARDFCFHFLREFLCVIKGQNTQSPTILLGCLPKFQGLLQVAHVRSCEKKNNLQNLFSIWFFICFFPCLQVELHHINIPIPLNGDGQSRFGASEGATKSKHIQEFQKVKNLIYTHKKHKTKVRLDSTQNWKLGS